MNADIILAAVGITGVTIWALAVAFVLWDKYCQRKKPETLTVKGELFYTNSTASPNHILINMPNKNGEMELVFMDLGDIYTGKQVWGKDI